MTFTLNLGSKEAITKSNLKRIQKKSSQPSTPKSREATNPELETLRPNSVLAALLSLQKEMMLKDTRLAAMSCSETEVSI